MSESILERALKAEEALEAAEERIADLTSRLQGVLNNEPESASRALSWVGRAQNAEKLLLEIVQAKLEMPPPLAARVRAQLQSVVILRRDQAALGEKPPDEAWWQGWTASDGHRLIRTEARERRQTRPT